ncbi:MAG TPA: hypothetical protein VHF88_06510 [Thermoleophilaceae bacterium]|nr:hypothetical protein [Thermoleophilaceae bacterium]
MDQSNNPAPGDLSEVADRLRESRSVPTPLELDELKLRARHQAARSSTSPGGNMLKSRLALTALIAVGAMMSGTGATLAVTGSSGSGSAEEHQYTTPTTTTETTDTTPTTETETTPTTETVTTTTTVTETTSTSQVDETRTNQSNDTPQPTLAPQDVAGDQDEGGDDGDSSPSEQVQVAGDSDDSLPFTGFLAIPLLIGGVAMIATGGILRHRSRDSQ